MTPSTEIERAIARRIRAILTERRSMVVPVADGVEAVAALRRGSGRSLAILGELAPRGQLEVMLADLRMPVALARQLMAAGAAQAEALAVMFDLDTEQRIRASDLGALFNFGICIFDAICDRFPTHRAALRSALGSGTLTSMMVGSRHSTACTNAPGLAFLFSLMARYFHTGREIASSRVAWDELQRTIQRMFAAQWSATETKRWDAPPTIDVLRGLRSKSVDPMWTIALGALIQRPDIHDLRPLRSMVRPAGEVLWLVDDLSDLSDDWRAGGWSRPWWIWVRRTGGAVGTAEDTALRGVLESGVVDQEAGCLADRIDRLRWSLPESGRQFFAKVVLSLRSWVEQLPT